MLMFIAVRFFELHFNQQILIFEINKKISGLRFSCCKFFSII